MEFTSGYSECLLEPRSNEMYAKVCGRCCTDTKVYTWLSC